MDDNQEMEKSFKIASRIGVAVIFSLFLYFLLEEGIRFYMKPFRGFVFLPEITILRYVFFGLAILEVIFVRLLQSLLLKRSSGDTAAVTIHKLSRTAIVTVCLSEVPALLGLLLFILCGLNKDFYSLLGVSLVLVFMYFPRRRNWEAWIERNC